MWLLIAACSLGPQSDPSKPSVERMPHFDEWPRLVAASAIGDTTVASTVARDLLAAPEYDSSELGAALGFLQIGDPEDLPAGVAAAAVACGACHDEHGVQSTLVHRGVDGHDAMRIVSSAVWGETPRLSGDLERAYQSVEVAEERIEAALKACQSCHLPKTPVTSAQLTEWCAYPCMGSVELWRQPNGEIDRVATRGTLEHCEHPATQWRALDGTVLHSHGSGPGQDGDAGRAGVEAAVGSRVLATEVRCK